MRWFRSRSRLGACLALFALAFQLAVSFAHVHLSFAHVHLDGGGPLSGHSPALLKVHGSTAAAAVRHRSGDEAPAPADDYCAICALTHLAGTAVAAAPPVLPVPAAFGRLRSSPAAEFALTVASHVLFTARAPPSA
jgi:DUF2946 family protein